MDNLGGMCYIAFENFMVKIKNLAYADNRN